jgi:ABC-type sugar transport system permease subunit
MGRKKMRKNLWLYLAPIAVALAVPYIIPAYFATPVVFQNCAVRQPTLVFNGESFGVEQFHSISSDGSVLNSIATGSLLCDRNLALSGTAADMPLGTRLRLFNVSDDGSVFLHEPPLTVVNGGWHTNNVRPGFNIREIRFVRVSDATSRHYSELASRNAWEAAQLPAQAQTVASIGLQSTPICSELDARKCTPATRAE